MNNKPRIDIKDWANKQNPAFVQKVVDEHYVLLNSIANKYSYKMYNKSDLIAEGSIGLLRAIQTFEPSKNVKFSTYAYFWIKNKIISFINSQNNIKTANYDKSSRIVYSLDMANTNITNESFEKTINIDEANIEEQYLQAFQMFISTIKTVDQHILLERMRNGTTLAELSRRFHLSRETIRQIEIKQINNFKFFLREVINMEDISGFIVILMLNLL